MKVLGLLASVLAFSSLAGEAGSQTTRVGVCGFDPTTLSFSGTEQAQARCLLRPIQPYGRLGAERALPQTLGRLVGAEPTLSSEALRRRLEASTVLGERALADTLSQPVSRARDGRADAPSARYFVIHDTSTPNFGTRPFPEALDTDARINSFEYYPRGDRSKAHMFVNRRGEIEIFRDFSIPWRATKLELRRVGVPAKGLFLHIELIQPRRNDDNGIDAHAPDQGFSVAQYDRLAALYAVASVRAGRWLIPAFHGAVDSQIDGGHDDPQRFDLAAFDSALRSLLEAVSDENTAQP